MKRNAKRIICFIIILTSLFMTGCCYYESSGDIIEIGFKPTPEHNGIVGAVRAKTNTFDIDDITMDFYFGGDIIDERYWQSVVLYFVNRKNVHSSKYPKTEEYRTSEEWYFMEEIDHETFNNGPFDVSIRFGYIGDNFFFRFKRKITIPKELFENESGQIAFLVAGLPQLNKEPSVYKDDTITLFDQLYIKYTILDNGKILIE